MTAFRLEKWAAVMMGLNMRCITLLLSFLTTNESNSTTNCCFQDVCPDKYIECFIAEQNLVGVAIGCAVRDRTVAFASTFAAFFTRAFDQIRMGAISQTNVNFVGSHCGVSIGKLFTTCYSIIHSG